MTRQQLLSVRTSVATRVSATDRNFLALPSTRARSAAYARSSLLSHRPTPSRARSDDVHFSSSTSTGHPESSAPHSVHEPSYTGNPSSLAGSAKAAPSDSTHAVTPVPQLATTGIDRSDRSTPAASNAAAISRGDLNRLSSSSTSKKGTHADPGRDRFGSRREVQAPSPAISARDERPPDVPPSIPRNAKGRPPCSARATGSASRGRMRRWRTTTPATEAADAASTTWMSTGVSSMSPPAASHARAAV